MTIRDGLGEILSIESPQEEGAAAGSINSEAMGVYRRVPGIEEGIQAADKTSRVCEGVRQNRIGRFCYAI